MTGLIIGGCAVYRLTGDLTMGVENRSHYAPLLEMSSREVNFMLDEGEYSIKTGVRIFIIHRFTVSRIARKLPLNRILSQLVSTWVFLAASWAVDCPTTFQSGEMIQHIPSGKRRAGAGRPPGCFPGGYLTGGT